MRRFVGSIGLLLAILSGFVFLYALLTPQPPSGEGDARVLALVFFGAVACGGLWLMGVGFPGLWGRVPGSIIHRLTNRESLRHPVTHTLAFYVVGSLLALVVPAPAAILTTLVVLTVFAVANPVALATGPRWPLRAAMSVVCFVLLLGLLSGTSEALSGRRFGEDAMVLLAPLLLYAFALPVSGVAWFVRHLRRKATT